MSSAQVPSRYITRVLAGAALIIVENDFVTKVTLLVTSGTATLQGSGLFPNTSAGGPALPSQPITLPNGTPVTFSGNRPSAPIDSVTIDASGGTVILFMQQ
jgi:hypothetical protein